MKTSAIFLFTLLLLASFSALAKIPGTAWLGDSELVLDGKLQCSEIPFRHPIYQPVYGGPLPTFTIHKGGAGWIWLEANGGCADGWFNSVFVFQVNGTKLFDSNGRMVGTITDDELTASDVTGEDKKTLVKNLSFKRTAETANAEVEFQRSGKKGTFQWSGSFNRFDNPK